VATRATDQLARLGVAHTVHRYEHDPRHPSYGQEASEALGHDTVFCSAGQRGVEIELAPADLVTAANARVAAIAR
jgi:prolyl-tRNA editing enzyme YbaK/EbsC (Cys-tRNA(Pro) deacylase)